VRANRLAQERRQLEVLAGQRAQNRMHQRDRALGSSRLQELSISLVHF
jgi:hypothetical protein